MHIAVVGAGYVGLTVAVALADRGHKVTCVDKDAAKVRLLEAGKVPFYEEGLDDYLTRGLGRRHAALHNFHHRRHRRRRTHIHCGRHAVEKRRAGRSERTCAQWRTRSSNTAPRRRQSSSKAPSPSAPEIDWSGTCGNGRAETGTSCPIRSFCGKAPPWPTTCSLIVSLSVRSLLKLPSKYCAVYEGFPAPILIVDRRTAELTKYVANGFLAAKISLINEIGDLCERVGVDVREVSKGVGLDHRIDS